MTDTARTPSTQARTGAALPSGARFASHVGVRGSRLALGLAIALILLLFVAPAFVPRSLVQDLLLFFVLLALAQCWNLMAGYAGLISVGQQAFVGLGAYALFAGVVLLGLDPLVAALLGSVAVAAISIPVGFLVFRLQGAYFAVVTWVVAEVFRLLLAQVKALGGGTGTSLPRSATSEMIGLEFVMALMDARSAVARELIIYWVALILAVAVTGAAYLLLRSRIGLALRAIADDEVVAQSMGISTLRVKFAVYVFAAFGAALAGALYFLQSGRVSPDAAFSVLDWTAYVIFIVVIGGIGTLEGPIIGAILFVLLQNLLSEYGPWYLIVLGGLGVAIMLAAPRGLWGLFSRATGIEVFPTRRRLTRIPAD